VVTRQQRERLAGLLIELVNGNVTSAEALRRAETWNDLPWKEKLFEDIYHALKHYEIDADIRARDSAYADSQTAGLRRWAEKLLKEGQAS
jgi:hypothetical protein